VRAAYSWNAANIGHIAQHGVVPDEAEAVANHPGRGHPRKIGDEKWLAWGRTPDGRYLQVIYILPADDEIDGDSLSLPDLIDYSLGEAEVRYVIHAMDLPDSGRRAYRRKKPKP
jgi:hypothetical protein